MPCLGIHAGLHRVSLAHVMSGNRGVSRALEAGSPAASVAIEDAVRHHGL
jgi:hypothetical protein